MERQEGSTIARSWANIRGVLDAVASVVVIVLAVAVFYRLNTTPTQRPARAATRSAPDAPLPKEPLSLANLAVKGDRSAKVGIVAFSDFQCPYCRAFAENIWPDLQRNYIDTGKVVFAFRHMPLDSIHPMARAVAEASECARRQGRFWEFHDALFKQQREIPKLDLNQFARAVGTDMPQFETCLANDARQVVEVDARLAATYGIAGTPTFFVGVMEVGGLVRATEKLVGARSLEDFAKAIENARIADK